MKRRTFVTMKIVFTGYFLIMTMQTAYAASSADSIWQQDIGAWHVTFDPENAILTSTHSNAGASVSGVLTFVFNDDHGQEASWQVALPRDSVKDRLALLDSGGNVQGYVTFSGSGDSFAIQVIHRAAQNYRGALHFDAVAYLGEETFACRTKPLISSRVVQMASGNADSLLNDSLFDVVADTTLQFDGKQVIITTVTDTADTKKFKVALSASIAEPGNDVIRVNLVQGYYRNHYVPHYQPLNRERCPVAPTGWMSWNVYFDKAGEKENLDEARVAAQYLKPYGMDIFSIESWQDNSPQLPVSKFHNLTLRPDPNKFPSGMKWLADEIRKLGFKPGIWTVPFGTGDKEFYESHKDWFLHNPDGQPIQNWCGLYILDPSQEAVRRHIEETHRIMSEEWGYEYFKVDGMSGRGPSYSAHFFERDDVRAAFKESIDDPFLQCVEAIRRGIGPDRIWLACQGHYTGTEIGYADAGRLGADIVAPNRPPEWHNYRNQALTTLNQLFVNNIVWYCDPDTLLVGEVNPLETVRLAASVVALTGQAMFAGDKLAELSPERMRLLQQCLPVCDVRPLDLFPIFEMLPVWDVKIQRPFGNWDVVSVFNWEEEAAHISVTLDELGLDTMQSYLVYDCWNRALQRNVKDGITAEVPGHGNALFAVYADVGHPQLVFSDRHLVQGGIGLKAVNWDATTKVLAGTVTLVQNDPTELVVAVPENFTFADARTDEGVRINAILTEPGLVSITLQNTTFDITNEEITWTLQY